MYNYNFVLLIQYENKGKISKLELNKMKGNCAGDGKLTDSRINRRGFQRVCN